MSAVGKFSPARIWRAFFVWFGLLALAQGAPSTNPVPELAQVGLPDAAETRRILEQFRQLGISGEYFETFELHALPRRGDEVVFRGRLWGGRNQQGAISRIELTDGAGNVRRLLLQNGEHAAVWRFADGRMVQLGVAALFEPLIPGLEITAFDLQMPYLYWPDAVLERIARVRVRPAHVFLFRAPAGFVAQHPEVTAVRGYFDTQYNVPVQTELVGAKGEVVKLTTLLDLKKIVDARTHEEQWVPKSIDMRNEVTRDKTRLLFTGAALKQNFPSTVFEPASLADEIRPPAADRIVRIEP